MIKLGFIDYYLDEWHANNYIPWIKAHSSGEIEVVAAYGDIDVEGKLTNAKWCAKNNVVQMQTIEELVSYCDGIIVLSPDNAEQHLRLSEKALKSGKPVYVDKTFANILGEAKAMFDTAQKFGAPIYSTSALRYAKEIENLESKIVGQEGISALAIRGQGNYENYSVHQLEMIVKIMGTKVEKVTYVGCDEAPCLIYGFEGERTAFLHHIGDSLTFAVNSKTGEKASYKVEQDFWSGFIKALVGFFKTGIAPVEKEETLAVISMYEAGNKAIATPFKTIGIES